MRKFSLILLTFFLSATFIFGQSTTGKIVGTVIAPDGAVPGATVVVTDNQTKKERTVTASDDGTFEVPQLEFGVYTVRITAAGFKSFTATDVKVDAAREYSLKAQLEVGQVSESVTVTAGAEAINSSNGELSSTISREQIRELPLNGRNPLALLNLTAGANPTSDSINGQRSSSTTITRDGLNVQDNFIRTGAFVPNRPSVDDTGEFTVTTQNAGAEQGGGSSIVQLVTPRGGSAFHGNLYEFNRNSEFTANTFFNNAATPGIPNPFLNRNEFGGSISGPVPIFNFGEGGSEFVKNKAFFFFNYEGFRLAQQVSASGTTLLAPARDGSFTYVNNAGQLVTVNVLNGANFSSPITAGQGGQLTVDPVIQSRVLANLPTSGNGIATGTNFTQVLNFNRSNPITRNAFTGRFDVDVNDHNSISFVYKHNNESNGRAEQPAGFSASPLVFQGGPTNFFTGAYTYSPNSRFSNEFRAGFQSSQPFFTGNGLPSDFLIGNLGIITSPEASFFNQGRKTLYKNVQDNAVYTIGNHSLRFGGQAEFFRVQSQNFAGTTPSYNISTTGNPLTPGLTANQFPGGINSTDLAQANALRYLLGGIIGSASRRANLVDATTGFGFGASNQDLNYKLYAAYVSDQWRIRPNLTVNLGLRYEYYTPLNSPQAIFLEPVVKNNDLVGSILDPNGTLNLVGGNSGTKGNFTKPDRNNFAPNISFAYTPRFEKGLFSKVLSGGTVIRGSFNIRYVNDEYIKSTSTLTAGNPGLGSQNITTGTNGNLAAALTPRNGFTAIPTITTLPTVPTLPITFAQNNAIQNFGSQVFGVDPNLQVQRVMEYNVGIQRNIGFKTVIEVRYVGGRSNELIRTTTFNQIDLRNNGFLSDFQKAQQNCRLQGATLAAAKTAYDPLFVCTDARYNPAIAGSQPLTVFNNLAGGGLLTNGSVIPLIQQGRAGSLGQLYITNRLTGTVPLVKNPNIFIDEILQNSGKFRYNALQAEIRRRFTNGLSFQVNYTFQKTLADVNNEDQNRQGEVQDNNNPRLNFGRPDYDRTHTINANAIYELPFGKGKRFLNEGGFVDKIFGGFQVTSIVNLSSGPPIGIIDPRSTSTITFTSGRQSATSSLTTSQIKQLTGTFRTPNGIYFIDPKVLNATITNPSTGETRTKFDLFQPLPSGFNLTSVRAASPLGQAPFPGQVFFFNQAGSTGNLPRNFINGLPYLNWDAGLSKNIHFTETTRLQLRVDAFNILNRQVPFFGTTTNFGGLDVNSNSFGRVTSSFNGPRIIQFGARFDF